MPDHVKSDVPLPPPWQDLVTASRQVREHAYAVYSKYAVGAAVLTDDGRVFVGCNVENASYGLTICAERVAVCSAVAAGQKKIIAACVSLTGRPVPCGACRQFLYEFNPTMLILLDNLDNANDPFPEAVCLSTLLPNAFRLEKVTAEATDGGPE
ncbi:MAG: cytidine deaminase [Planctomycetaceae bacterium]